MRSTSAWASLFGRVGDAAIGAGLRSRPTSNCSWHRYNSITTNINRRLVEKHKTAPSPLRSYTTQAGPAKPRKRRTGLYVAGGAILAGGITLAVTDEARYIYIAAQRTGRVVSTLALNINEYVWLLPSTLDIRGILLTCYPDIVEH